MMTKSPFFIKKPLQSPQIMVSYLQRIFKRRHRDAGKIIKHSDAVP